MTDWITAFAGGLLGSAHCVGMCGGFAAIVGSRQQPLCQAAAGQITYHLGRVFTYSCLGAIAGFAGHQLATMDNAILAVQNVASIVAGVAMILVGIATLGVFSAQKILPTKWSWKAAQLFGTLLRLPGRRGLFLGGVANGFLPCGLVYAFLAMAVATEDVGGGLLIMLLFGLGTVPAMTLVGCGSNLISLQMRTHVLRLAALLVIVTGGICIKRGWPSDEPCCSHAPVEITQSEP